MEDKKWKPECPSCGKELSERILKNKLNSDLKGKHTCTCGKTNQYYLDATNGITFGKFN